MSLNVLRAAADAENADGLHLARLLGLLRNADSVGRSKPKPVEGITKLAKLDFLLRYPIYLERALIQLGKSPDAAAVLPRERTTVETKMIRFRYRSSCNSSVKRLPRLSRANRKRERR
ncbi:hypothetical protein [Sphingomonas sp. SRS2]|uniref:hypothetical protein n=1 Tax=Sphingomonas sp. SRS2 TaxID=133190 RepID=UPI0006988D58|nr:hypothetical protein [Sphingomonas sp. SRS2]